MSLRNSKEVRVVGLEGGGESSRRGHRGGHIASCKHFVYCPEERRCSCRVLVVGFPCTRRPWGSNILGELNFLLLPSVQDPDSSKSEALAPAYHSLFLVCRMYGFLIVIY